MEIYTVENLRDVLEFAFVDCPKKQEYMDKLLFLTPEGESTAKKIECPIEHICLDEYLDSPREDEDTTDIEQFVDASDSEKVESTFVSEECTTEIKPPVREDFKMKDLEQNDSEEEPEIFIIRTDGEDCESSENTIEEFEDREHLIVTDESDVESEENLRR